MIRQSQADVDNLDRLNYEREFCECAAISGQAAANRSPDTGSGR